jgi:nitrate/nitrite transporter NarK
VDVGISLYTPEILEKIFGDDESLSRDFWQNIMSTGITLPAALATIWLLGRVSSKDLQLAGFGVATVVFALMAGLWSTLKRDSTTALFLLFLVQKNASIFGVASTTFVLPNELFPREVRSSCNGLSAAAGKLGAFVGSFIFPYVYENFSMSAVFYGCALTSGLGMLVTLAFIPTTVDSRLSETERAKGTAEADGVSESTSLIA